MAWAGSLATSSTAPHTDNSASSCAGRSNQNQERHYKISQIVITQTKDFRWKVNVFSRERCELVEVFSSPDKMWLWVSDMARLHTWSLIDGVGL